MPQTCYYDLLRVERTATQDELRTSYRKRALQLHPDKNQDRVEEATRQFALLQQAYEVLGDPQERAWYDSHREAILRGGGDVPSQYESEGITVGYLMKYFSASCYQGFGDDPGSFYVIYGELFARLASEEEVAAAVDQSYGEDFFEDNGGLPDPALKVSFGGLLTPFVQSNKLDSANSLKAFYVAWQHFSTKKRFRWRDKWRLSEAPDRRYRRAMEKENKKARSDARKEYNDTVRQLATFVKKRDPRVKAYSAAAKLEQERRSAARKAQIERERAERQAAARLYEAPEWAQVSQEDLDLAHRMSALGHADGEGGEQGVQNGEAGSDDEDIEEEFVCVVCEKTFHSDSQFQNHARSKKHQKNLWKLRKQMLNEENALTLEASKDGTSADIDQC